MTDYRAWCTTHSRMDCEACVPPALSAAYDFPPAPSGLSQSQWERLLHASINSPHIHAALNLMRANRDRLPADALAETLLAVVADRDELLKTAIALSERTTFSQLTVSGGDPRCSQCGHLQHSNAHGPQGHRFK